MLRTNLSTRPFYNERAVHLALAAVAALLLAITAVNLSRLVALSAKSAELTAEISGDEAEATRLTRAADAIRRGIDRKELEAVVTAARQANDIIDQRTFSWTEFFNLIETTLPADVMLTSVRPQVREAVVTVTMEVMGRTTEDIDQFMDQLEATGAFSDLFPRQEEVTAEGLHKTLLQGRYLGVGDRASRAPESGGRRGA